MTTTQVIIELTDILLRILYCGYLLDGFRFRKYLINGITIYRVKRLL